MSNNGLSSLYLPSNHGYPFPYQQPPPTIFPPTPIIKNENNMDDREKITTELKRQILSWKKYDTYIHLDFDEDLSYLPQLCLIKTPDIHHIKKKQAICVSKAFYIKFSFLSETPYPVTLSPVVELHLKEKTLIQFKVGTIQLLRERTENYNKLFRIFAKIYVPKQDHALDIDIIQQITTRVTGLKNDTCSFEHKVRDLYSQFSTKDLQKNKVTWEFTTPVVCCAPSSFFASLKVYRTSVEKINEFFNFLVGKIALGTSVFSISYSNVTDFKPHGIEELKNLDGSTEPALRKPDVPQKAIETEGPPPTLIVLAQPVLADPKPPQQDAIKRSNDYVSILLSSSIKENISTRRGMDFSEIECLLKMHCEEFDLHFEYYSEVTVESVFGKNDILSILTAFTSPFYYGFVEDPIVVEKDMRMRASININGSAIILLSESPLTNAIRVYVMVSPIYIESELAYVDYKSDRWLGDRKVGPECSIEIYNLDKSRVYDLFNFILTLEEQFLKQGIKPFIESARTTNMNLDPVLNSKQNEDQVTDSFMDEEVEPSYMISTETD
jgi:hypothetical protein